MKPKDPIWSFFDITEDGSKRIAKCKIVVSSKSERLKAHRIKCCGDSGILKTKKHPKISILLSNA